MKRLLTLCTVLLALCTSLSAVAPDPRVLDELWTQGDVARYEQMVRQGAVISRRRPAHTLVERAATAEAKAPRREFGLSPLMAERGLLILVNFQDVQFRATNTQAEMDSMMNAYHYSYNDATGSAAQYYRDQSKGMYCPHFDVVGPVTLPQKMAYYGTNDADGFDQKLGDLVLHACSIAAAMPDVDFTRYDADHDGVVDFVYLLYAGYAEAQGAPEETIWPCSWDLPAAIYEGYSSLRKSYWNKTQYYTFDGMVVNSFACSQELDGSSGSTRSGIGTPAHEFGHVLGLPDLYNTEDSGDSHTPGNWAIMAGGSYNNKSRTPPSLSPWEKQFLGWHTPINLGNVGADVVLYPNGSENEQVYQLNASGVLQGPTEEGVCYYIENRQKSQKWDAGLPGHGMLIWRLDYDSTAWVNNAPNNNPYRYTIVSATGSTTVQNTKATPFPGLQKVTKWNGLTDKPITEIVETVGSTVTLRYMGGSPTGVEAPLQLSPKGEGVKCLRNGQVVIVREGKIYNIFGYEL